MSFCGSEFLLKHNELYSLVKCYKYDQQNQQMLQIK